MTKRRKTIEEAYWTVYLMEGFNNKWLWDAQSIECMGLQLAKFVSKGRFINKANAQNSWAHFANSYGIKNYVIYSREYEGVSQYVCSTENRD